MLRTAQESVTIEEQVGVAFGASALVVDARRPETPALRIAAVGGAAATMAAGSYSDRAALAALLAARLWRMRFGGDITAETGREVVWAWSRWIALGEPWQREPEVTRAELLVPFACQVLGEWLYERCAYCAGCGQQEIRAGQRVRPRRFGDPRVRHVPCGTCGGSGLRQVGAAERAAALSITLDEYRAHWPRRFAQALAQLGAVAHRLRRPLRAQLERITVRT